MEGNSGLKGLTTKKKLIFLSVSSSFVFNRYSHGLKYLPEGAPISDRAILKICIENLLETNIIIYSRRSRVHSRRSPVHSRRSRVYSRRSRVHSRRSLFTVGGAHKRNGTGDDFFFFGGGGFIFSKCE